MGIPASRNVSTRRATPPHSESHRVEDQTNYDYSCRLASSIAVNTGIPPKTRWNIQVDRHEDEEHWKIANAASGPDVSIEFKLGAEETFVANVRVARLDFERTALDSLTAVYVCTKKGDIELRNASYRVDNAYYTITNRTQEPLESPTKFVRKVIKIQGNSLLKEENVSSGQAYSILQQKVASFFQ